MAVQVKFGVSPEKDPMDDYLFRTQMQHSMVQDRGTTYKNVRVKVDAGPVKAGGKRETAEITLRYALDQPYIFACFSENLAAFEGTSYDEWKGAATDALHKFAAIKGFQIKFGPSPEGDNRYNIMVELDKVIEVDPVLVRARQEAREREEEAARLEEAAAKRLAAMQRSGQF